MKNRTLQSTFLLASLLFTGSLFGQPSPGSKLITTPGGAKVRTYGSGVGRKAGINEFVQFHITVLAPNDSILGTTHEGDSRPQITRIPSKTNGELEEGLKFVSEGDSAVIEVSESKFVQDDRARPSFLPKGSYLKMCVRVVKVLSKGEFSALEGYDDMKDILLEEDRIAQYIADKNLTATRTASGLYYVITSPGTGENARPGQQVTVHYTGTLLNGNKFDSSRDRNQPFSFKLGGGQVIAGWDEGIALLNKGAKATLIIPSKLGYGPQSIPGGQGGEPLIPSNSPLIFDVELVDFK